MKKKIALLVSVLLFIGFFFFFVFYSEQPYTVGKLEKGSLTKEVEQAKELLQELSQSFLDIEFDISFRGERLAHDKTQQIWYLPVDMENSDWEKGSFAAIGEGVTLLPLQDYTLLEKQEVVAEGMEIPFLVWDEKKAVCQVVSVVFTGLPIVEIETDADLDIDTVFAGGIRFFEDCSQEQWTQYSVFQAHERGQTTRAYPKKGYRVNLISVTSSGVIKKNPKSVLGMRNSDSWIFYAMYSDDTKIRDKFNIELWNCFGAENTAYQAHFGTHMEYAELIVNGEYRGLYGIMEPIDTTQLGISEQEYLYKRTYGRNLDSEVFLQASPEEYLTTLGMEIKGKDGFGTKADWTCFQNFVKMCEMEDADFAREVSQLLNLENFADIWIYLQFLYGEDNIYKNMFFAFKRESMGHRLYLVPWDMDLTWGNVYTDNPESLYVTFSEDAAQAYLEWPFADRVISLNVGEIRQKISTRWRELRQSVFSEQELDRLWIECKHLVQDSGAFVRDAKRWPNSHQDGNYEQMQAFMKSRMKYLDKCLKD